MRKSYATKGEHCPKCPLYVLGDGFVRGDGPQPAPILLVGEAPGEEEALSGKPFVGSAGTLLNHLLKGAGIDRTGFRVANTLCCRPPKNYLAGAPYEASAISACHPYLEEEIQQTKPKVIVAFGNTALKRLCGVSGITRYRGFPLRHTSGAWVVPTYHPSFLLPRRGQKESAKLTGLVVMDLLRAVEIAAKGFEMASFDSYVLDPRPENAELWAVEFEASGSPFMSVDIETPGKMRFTEEEIDLSDEDRDDEFGSVQILRCAYSYAPGKALSIPWTAPFMGVHRRLLSHIDKEYIFWNGYAFDLPILKLNGMDVKGMKHDAMWAWHTLQSDLPRGLEAVASVYAPELGPWKHLSGSKPALYNAIDADAALRNFLGTKKDLLKNDQWDVYQKHVVDLHPILFEAGRVHGVSIDRFAQNALRAELETDRDALLREAQKAVGSFRFKPPKTFSTEKLAVKNGLKGDIRPVDGVKMVSKCTNCGKERVTQKHLKGECFDARVEKVPQQTIKYQIFPKWEELSGDDLLRAVDEVGFNPVSTKQLQAYARFHKHPLPKDYKTGKEQIDKKARRALIKRFGAVHHVYPIAQKLQTITKTLGTYVIGYLPDKRGKIYTTYTFNTSSGRLASANKNLQNVTHSGENPYSAPIRRTIVPLTEGHVFVEVDSSAIEAKLTGYFMNDPLYMELATKGVHDYITCLEFGFEFDTAKLKEYRKDSAYENARDRNKRVIHGTSYGMTPKMMVMQFPGFFKTERDAAFAQQRFLEAVPRLGEWQHEVRVMAHRQQYLINPWGYRHYYYQVFVNDFRTKKTVLGPDAKRVVSFLPQSSAAAIMKDTLLEVGGSKWRAYTPANLSIHDSVCLDVPQEMAEEAIEYLTTLMSRPIPQLGGLAIGCEAKIGRNWADMQVVKKVVC